MKIKTITKDDFDEEVLKSEALTVVDFWAPWCGPCGALTPILEEINVEFSGKIKICKVNIDENGEMASEYKIMSIPTVMLFKDGKMVSKLVGARDKIEYIELIEANL